MAKYHSIDPAILRKLLRYDPDSGVLYWRPRSGQSAWNTKYAGKEAMISLTTNGYRCSRINGIPVRVHQVIWAMIHGGWAAGEIDHVNGDRRDNRIANLRLVTRQQNNRNMAKRCDNTSGVTGVTWDKQRGKWSARIRHGGVFKALGRFDSIEAAAEARERAMREYGYHTNHGKRAA